ncbi:MAG: alpha/beta hydrolase [Tetrasphaera sp.]|nr:alpha/beta hydrolase [Tetrasphaera sp.]
MRAYRGMSARTRLTSMLIDRMRRPIETMTEADIHKERATLVGRGRGQDALTGGVDPQVAITFGTAPARDEESIGLRIYRPRTVGGRDDIPVIVYLHGGGWVLGNVVNYDPICSLLAAQVGALVVSVDYRMAPEHRAPTAAHDVVDAMTWVAAQGDVLRADTSRMAVAGDSAGGNLAAVAAQVLRDNGIGVLRHQALIYPATDMTMSSPSVWEHAHGSILTKASMDAFADHYAPAGVDRRDPLLSPLFGRLDALPPALIQTADLDPIRDDGVRYADALRSAGVAVRLTNYLGVPHGFAQFPFGTPIGAQHRWELVHELRRHLH